MTDRLLLHQQERVPAFDATGWVLRIAVCAVFVGVGATKFQSQSMWVGMFDQIGLGNWFRYLTGGLQVAGGLLFLVPRTAPIGAIVTGCTMAGAILVHLFVLPTGVGGAVIPCGLLVFALVVGLRKPPED
jgi:putative oxidoreductase